MTDLRATVRHLLSGDRLGFSGTLVIAFAIGIPYVALYFATDDGIGFLALAFALAMPLGSSLYYRDALKIGGVVALIAASFVLFLRIQSPETVGSGLVFVGVPSGATLCAVGYVITKAEEKNRGAPS